MTSRNASSRASSGPAKCPSERKHCGWMTSSQSPRSLTIAWTRSAASRFSGQLGATTAMRMAKRYTRSAPAPQAPLLPRLHELQRILIGVTLDRLVEDRLGVIVGGVPEELAFGDELESGGGHLLHDLIAIDPVQLFDLPVRQTCCALVVDDHVGAARLQRFIDGAIEGERIDLAELRDLQIVIILG